jgi:alpha-N-arabinofuranosidase
MSAKTTAATNSITQPSAIVPVETGLKDVASQFSHTMPGYSIQILQLKAH